jgi:hypothetical protein
MLQKNEIRCPDCDCLLKQKDFNKGVCWKCDTSIINLKKKFEQEEKKREKEEADSVERQNPKSTASSNSKYYALQIISSILTFIGWISIIFGVIWFIYLLSSNPFQYSGVSAVILLQLILPIIAGIINIALSQLINLFINIANDVNKIKNKDE